MQEQTLQLEQQTKLKVRAAGSPAPSEEASGFGGGWRQPEPRYPAICRGSEVV